MVDGERPDTLSYKLYGRADLHWLILLVNEIHDPYFGWPLSSSQLEAHIDDRYPGIAIYLKSSSENIKQGQDVYLKSGSSYSKIGTVMKWSPTYLKLEVSETTTLISNNSVIRIGEEGDDVDVFRSELNKYAIHHFEKDGLEVASFASFSSLDSIPLPNEAEPIIVSYAKGTSTEIALLAVDNYAYEQRINDGKREIRVLKKDYLEDVFRLMRESFKVV